ncbi:MAG TPA: hypothetical protein VIY69_07305 [Candidatus Acidoferrales bacterium]
MNRHIKSSCIAAACLALLFGAATISTSAQGGSAGPPPGRGFRGPGPMGPDDALGFVGFEGGLFGKTVTGAPFTADVSTETSEVLSDGNRIDNKTTGTLARDSEGRTRRDLTLPLIGGYSTSGNGNGPAHAVVINDPVAGSSYVLNENRKQARKTRLLNNVFRGNAANRDPNSTSRPNSPNVTSESLGTQLIGGIQAEGTRTTRTIPVGQIGNEKAIQVVVERWYSPDLQMDILIKRSDPRGGTTVFQVTNVVRSEPDSSLFQVPSDYTVVNRASGPRRGMNRQAPAPPPQQ